LEQQAIGASKAERYLAEAKSARNEAAGDVGASYMWSEREGQAIAALKAKLSTLDTLSRSERGKDKR